MELTESITLSAVSIEEQFRRFCRYPLRRRFEPMSDHLLESIYVKHRFSAPATERNVLKKEIKNVQGKQRPATLQRFLCMGRPEMFRIDKNRTLEYADLAPLAYLYPALEGTDSRTDIRHLLIDEMQDYSPYSIK